MASVSTDSKGNRTIQFVAKDQKRRSIRLGKMPLKMVREIKLKVQALNYAAISGQSVDGETARWVADRDRVLTEKLAAVGLIELPEDVGGVTVSSFIDAYLTERVDLKPGTLIQLRQVQKNLITFVGLKMTLREFTPGNADAFKTSLTSKLADNSVRRNLGRCRQFFEAAVRKRLIGSNPFVHLKGITVKGNAERFRFVTHAEIQQVIDAAPDAQWRVIIALARFGGVRTPSETLALKWSDVDWISAKLNIQRGIVRQRVGDCKTEYSNRPLTVDAGMLDVLKLWKQASQFPANEDWIFASPAVLGRLPWSYDHVRRSFVKAGTLAGIGHVSTHTMRHTYRSWLDAVGTPIAVQQKMMRHSDIRTTMNIYGDIVTDEMATAGSKVAGLALNGR